MACSDTAKGSAKMACSSSMASGTAKSIGRVGRHQLGVATGRVARHPGVDADADVTGGKAPAQAVVAGLARRAQRADAARRARQPRVEHDALAHLEAVGLRAELGDLGHHLVAHHLGERAQPAHGAVAVALTEVEEDLLGVRAADAGEEGAGDQPVGAQRAGVRDLAQRDRGHGQVAGQAVGALRGGPGLRVDPEDQCLHLVLLSWASSRVKLRFDPQRNRGGRRCRITTA